MKNFNEFINKPELKINENIQDFYIDYQKLMSQGEDNDLYDELGELTLTHNLSKEDVGFIVNNYDTTFDMNDHLYTTYINWIDDGLKYSDSDETIELTKEELINFRNDCSGEQTGWSDTSYKICKFIGIDPTEGI